MRVPDARAGSPAPHVTTPSRAESGNGTKRDRLIVDTEMPGKAIIDRWFASFWGASYDPTVVDELAAPDVLLQYSMHNPRRGRPAKTN